MIVINKSQLKKIIKKALIYQVFSNIDQLLEEADISHRSLSYGTGRAENWFNDAYNNNEDIRLSSLTKVLAYISPFEGCPLEKLICRKSLRYGGLLNTISDEEEESITTFLQSDKDLLQDLIGDLGVIESKKKLTIEELHVLKNLRKINEVNE
ncbi:hypothetical protein [Shouchella rhizosphaerae]|uniref:hypothetical protein n=1 Tax=Shouchella rhizosphaerae TaxID=866786 RepID=UPI0009195D6D|nr:hypothetical protein [Shouchella rhizosphaerae]SHL24260.1 hypothetical protein SAMN05192535_1451 [Shouchella rhizosphaerae]